MRRYKEPIHATVSTLDDDPLLVFGASKEMSDGLILFVHGLNGDRFETWGHFATLFFDLGFADVGLYGYSNGLRRTYRASISLENQSKELAHQLRDCTYQRIFMIGHSMGGLLCLDVVRHLIEDGTPKAIETVRRFAGILLLGTPQAGSKRVPRFLKFLFSDLRFLEIHSDFATKIHRLFTNHVTTSGRLESPGKYLVPTYALEGLRDKWVDQMSATLGLPSDHTKAVFVTHTGLAKPRDSESQIFKFSRGVVEEEFGAHKQRTASTAMPPIPLNEHWDDFISPGHFYGRTNELREIKKFVIDGRCRAVAILGMGGIGKTTLSIKFAQQVKDSFTYLYRLELKNAPAVEEAIASCVKFLSGNRQTQLPTDLNGLTALLLQYLRLSRCLLIFDNAEEILKSGETVGSYRENYEGYGALFRKICETDHQSCLLLTSREKPREISLFEGKDSLVQSLVIRGLDEHDGTELLRESGLSGADFEFHRLVDVYLGNPLALRILPSFIQEVFGGNIALFLRHEIAAIGDIREVLHEQVDRLSILERAIILWLAVIREPTGFDTLFEYVLHVPGPASIVEAVASLCRRALVERSSEKFLLQPPVMEYITDTLVRDVSMAIAASDASWCLHDFLLLNAQANDHVRKTGHRLILMPIIRNLIKDIGRTRLCDRFSIILKDLREHGVESYAASNILSLLLALGVDLSKFDFSEQTLRCVYLQSSDLRRTNFRGSFFRACVFMNSFGTVNSVAFRPHSSHVVLGCGEGTLRVFDTKSGEHLQTVYAHNDWIRSIAFSVSGDILASASDDATVRLWHLENGICINEITAHIGRVFCVAFSPVDDYVASGGADGTVIISNIVSGQRLLTLNHGGGSVYSVAFSSDGSKLASGGGDHKVRVWDCSNGSCLAVLEGHSDRVSSVCFTSDSLPVWSGSYDGTVRAWGLDREAIHQTIDKGTRAVLCTTSSPDGRFIATAGVDQVIRLWEASSHTAIQTLEAHDSWVNSLCFSADSRTLISGSADQTARLWDTQSGDPIRTLQGFICPVWSLSVGPDNGLLASGHGDGTVRIWPIQGDQKSSILPGHKGWVWAVAFLNRSLLLSGGADGIVRLWDVVGETCIREFKGHQGPVRGLTASPLHQIVVSCGQDQTARMWQAETGACIRLFRGHTDLVESVSLSPDATMLATASADRTVRIWDVGTGRTLKILGEKLDRVRCTKFSPDGNLLAACTDDGTVHIWSAKGFELIRKLRGHAGRVIAIDFSPDSRFVVSCSVDKTLRMWSIESGECLQIFVGHRDQVRTVSFGGNSETLLSGGLDEEIRLWSSNSGKATRTLKCERPYEMMDITDVSGLTEAETMTLIRLGAVAS